MPTLSELRTRVRQRLDEQTAAIWTDAELDEAIAATLEEYNHLFPAEQEVSQAVSEGATAVTLPAGSRAVVRVALTDGRVLPRRGEPQGSTADEAAAWETFAGELRFSQPLPAQTLTLWLLADHVVTDVPEGDAGLLVLGGVWRALVQRSVQDFKRGGPLAGVSYELVIRSARDEYERALDRHRRRVRTRLVSGG
jgi:hypothetical protein